MITRILKIISIILIFIIAAGISTYLALVFIIKSEDPVIVPNLVGKDIVKVLETLNTLGLNAKITGSEYSTQFLKNQIIIQDPDPGIEIKKGRSISIILSKGEQMIKMPDMVGLSIQQALIIIEKNELLIGIISKTNNHTQKNSVIAQFPCPNTKIEKGVKVNLLISDGQKQKSYQIPNFKGLSLEESLLIIEQNNLTAGKIITQADKNTPDNCIISQTPLPGYCVEEGSIINLVVNNILNPNNANFTNLQGVHLFKYKVEKGFLNKNITIKVNIFGSVYELFNEFVKPGQDVYLLIPKGQKASVFLYESDDLLQIKTFN